MAAEGGILSRGDSNFVLSDRERDWPSHRRGRWDEQERGSCSVPYG